MNLQLEKKRALVTGSNSGIGEAIAKALAAEGTAVVVHGRDETKTRRWLTKSLDRVAAPQLRSAIWLAMSKRSVSLMPPSQRSAASTSLSTTPVCFPVRGWWDTASAQWLEIYNQNVAGSVRLIQALAPPMRERRWGGIIQISSGMGLLPSPQMADYAAIKIVNILTTVSLSLELADSGVTVNTVKPRARFAHLVLMISSTRWRASAAPMRKTRRLRARYRSSLCAASGGPKRSLTLSCSSRAARASYINGVNLRVDGGYVKGF
jgi:3-oxoacyl-[acyl-carrier protein] reductase